MPKTFHITIKITEEEMAAARSAYPNTFPARDPFDWTTRNLRAALDVLSADASNPSAGTISHVEVTGS